MKNQIKNKSKKGIAIWFTGLSGAGKSTLASALKQKLESQDLLIKELDGDQLRNGINSGLGFSETDRHENIRRAAEVAKLFIDSDFITICSFITPTETMRELARNIIGSDQYFEVYVKCSIEECEIRDVKGLYKKARAGNVPNFTGISSNFETPQYSDVIVDTESIDIENCVELIYSRLIDTLQK